MKAVLLCAGKGTRLAPLTHTRPKHDLPLGNRPLIAHLFDACRRLGLSEVIVVLHPTLAPGADELAQHADGLVLHAAYQDEPNGLADAVRTAAPFLGADRFLLLLGDTLLTDAAIRQVAQTLHEPGSKIYVQPVENPCQYGVAVVRGGQVVRLLEKPQRPPSNLALVGLYQLEPSIFPAIERIQPSPRGELEITDAIDRLVQDGERVEAVELAGRWLDCGSLDGALEANRAVLDRLGAPNDMRTREPAHRPARGTCRITPPVAIGSNVVLEDCEVGPYASIGAGCVIRGGAITNSIVLEGASIENARCQNAIVGARARIVGGEGSRLIADRILGDEEVVEPTPLLSLAGSRGRVDDDSESRE